MHIYSKLKPTIANVDEIASLLCHLHRECVLLRRIDIAAILNKIQRILHRRYEFQRIIDKCITYRHPFGEIRFANIIEIPIQMNNSSRFDLYTRVYQLPA